MAMSTTVTVKNIPDEIYDNLKRVASAQHRSINSEVIACLERAMLPGKINNEELIDRARKIRGSLKGHQFSPADIQQAINEGRP
jgi:plasmid stability protein